MAGELSTEGTLPDLSVVTVSQLDDETWRIEVDYGDMSPYEALGMLRAAALRLEVQMASDGEDDLEADE